MPGWECRYYEGEIEHETHVLDFSEACEILFKVLLADPLRVASHVDLHEITHMINNSNRVTIEGTDHIILRDVRIKNPLSSIPF